MPGRETGAEMKSEELGRVGPFFSAAHWARYLLVVLLGASAAGTSVQAIRQMVSSTQQVSGGLIEVTETRISNSFAIYSLVLLDDRGEFSYVRLRNNGRILNYLSAQEKSVVQRVVVEQSRDVAQSLTLLDGNNLSIRESKVSSLFQLFIGVLLLVVLALHMLPA